MNVSYLQNTSLSTIDRAVKTEDANVLLASILLRLHETSCTLDAHNQAASDFRVKCSAVPRLLDTKDPLHPRNNFVRRRIGRLV